MTLPTEYRRQLFYFLGGSGVYAGVISLLYIDWLLIGPYLTAFGLAAALTATLAPLRRVIHHYIHVIHDTPARKRINYMILSLCSLILLTYSLEVTLDLNTSHFIIFILIGTLVVLFFTLPSVMDRDTLTAIFMVSSFIVSILAIGILMGNAVINETNIVIQYIENLVHKHSDQIQKYKDKDNVVIDALNICEQSIDYIKSIKLPDVVYTSTGLDKQSPAAFCTDKVTFVRDNAQSYMSKVQDLASEHASTAGQVVGNKLKDVFSNIAALPMQTIVFLLLLFYFIQYEPRIRSEVWRLSPFSAEETTALVHSLNDKVAKTIGQSLLKSICGFVITYFAFTISNFNIKLIFSFLAGILELTPFTSPFLVWIPSLITSVIVHGIYSYKTPVMLFLYIVDLLIINTQINSLLNIREQNPTIMSMSILLGAAAFG